MILCDTIRRYLSLFLAAKVTVSKTIVTLLPKVAHFTGHSGCRLSPDKVTIDVIVRVYNYLCGLIFVWTDSLKRERWLIYLLSTWREEGRYRPLKPAVHVSSIGDGSQSASLTKMTYWAVGADFMCWWLWIFVAEIAPMYFRNNQSPVLCEFKHHLAIYCRNNQSPVSCEFKQYLARCPYSYNTLPTYFLGFRSRWR